MIYIFIFCMSIFLAFILIDYKNKYLLKVGLGNNRGYAPYISTNDLRKKIYILIAFIPFVTLLIFRYNVGTDYYQYIHNYYLLGINSESKEYLFEFIIYIARFFNNPLLIPILLGLLTYYFIAKFIDDFSTNISFSIVMIFTSGFFFMSCTMMRQCLSIAIFMYATKYLLKGKYITFSFFIIFAYLFHTSSIIYFVFMLCYILIKNIKFSQKKRVFFTICSLLVIYLMGSVLRNILFDFFSMIGRYEGYFGSNHDMGNFSGSHFLIGIAPLIPCLLNFENNKKNKLLCLICFFSSLFTILMPVIPNGERLIFMFSTVSIVSNFELINTSKYSRNNKNFLLIFTTLIGFVGFFVYFFVRKSLDVFPYESIFDYIILISMN